jgi:hypothetical protein
MIYAFSVLEPAALKRQIRLPHIIAERSEMQNSRSILAVLRSDSLVGLHTWRRYQRLIAPILMFNILRRRIL